MAGHRPGFIYLDIETSGLDAGIHAVIAAAVQRMDANGPTQAEPLLLTSWGLGGEQAVLKALWDLGLFIHQGPHKWDLIPVGPSLDFTLAFAAERLRVTGAEPWEHEDTIRFLSVKPRSDLKGALIVMNHGAVEGADVRRFTRRKVGSGSDVVRMFAQNDFARIERYIRAEAAAFFDVYPALSKDLRNFGDRLLATKKIKARSSD